LWGKWRSPRAYFTSGNGVRWIVSRDRGVGLFWCVGAAFWLASFRRPHVSPGCVFLSLLSWVCYLCCWFFPCLFVCVFWFCLCWLLLFVLLRPLVACIPIFSRLFPSHLYTLLVFSWCGLIKFIAVQKKKSTIILLLNLIYSTIIALCLIISNYIIY
jgi:hypothetical protein